MPWQSWNNHCTIANNAPYASSGKGVFTFRAKAHFDQRVFFRQPNGSSSHFVGLIFTASNKKSIPWHITAEILLGLRQGMVPVKI